MHPPPDRRPTRGPRPSTRVRRRALCGTLSPGFCPTTSRRRPGFIERTAFTLGQNERVLSPKIVFAKTGQNSNTDKERTKPHRALPLSLSLPLLVSLSGFRPRSLAVESNRIPATIKAPTCYARVPCCARVFPTPHMEGKRIGQRPHWKSQYLVPSVCRQFANRLPSCFSRLGVRTTIAAECSQQVPSRVPNSDGG